MESVNMLIDFNSPVHKKELSVPLIPVPPQIELLPKEMCEPCIDPFEVQDAPDPFEEVLQNAVNNEQSEVDLGPNSNSKQCKTAEPKVSTDSKTENPIFHKKGENEVLENPGINEDPASCPPQDDLLNKPPLENDQALSMNTTIPDCKVDFENSHNTTSVHNNTHTLKDSLKSVSVAENENRSQTSADFSTEESIKAVIARRVNRCIQDTLNGSIKTNKNVDDSLFKKPQNRRSLSFIGLSSASVKKECNRLNKSCIDVNDSFDLENQKLDASGKLIDASSDSSGFGLLSPNTTDASAEGDGEDQVFKEAHRISRTFSKLAESFRQEQASDSDDEDLMSCKPRWLYTDSSEDEEEKLLKDPALNFRRRSNDSALSSSVVAVAPPNGNVPDSPALLAYKSRRSFTNLQAAHNTQEELTLKRSISIGSKLKEVPVIPTLAASGPVNLLKSNDQPLKLRKHATGDVKRGPLRAVMPIQSMTKDPLPVTGKISLKQDTSPEARSHKTVYAIGTPIKDNSQLNMIPMASSTPNKDESFASSKANTNSLMKPTMLVAANKRHSLEGSFGSHKSRDAVSEAGARPRSNSVNSSIPRVMQAKPLRGFPLAPKSTSSLTRVANTNINANNVSKLSEKKNASHQKTNVKKARVLAEVKTKSPLQSKVRTAVNAISGLVRGKKTAARDKENRFPA